MSAFRSLEPQWLEHDGAGYLVKVTGSAAAIAAAQFAHRAAEAAAAAGIVLTPARKREEEIIGELSEQVVDWRGVPDDEGQPVPCTPLNVEALMRSEPGLALQLGGLIAQRLAAFQREKKASSTSPAGTGTATASDQGPPSAPAAGSSASLAPAPNGTAALTSSSRPKRAKRRTSGGSAR